MLFTCHCHLPCCRYTVTPTAGDANKFTLKRHGAVILTVADAQGQIIKVVIKTVVLCSFYQGTSVVVTGGTYVNRTMVGETPVYFKNLRESSNVCPSD